MATAAYPERMRPTIDNKDHIESDGFEIDFSDRLVKTIEQVACNQAQRVVAPLIERQLQPGGKLQATARVHLRPLFAARHALATLLHGKFQVQLGINVVYNNADGDE